MSIGSLQFEASCSIKSKQLGLREPSGLAFDPEGTLWTVCDRSRRLFQLDTNGQILSTREVDNKGLEGITFDAEGKILVVDEDAGKILKYDPDTGKEIADRRLQDMEGFCAVARYFEEAGNNGLEGITCDPLRSEILLLKEADPGLLIAVSDDLQRIVAVDHLDGGRGFVEDELEPQAIDFSGLCYDRVRDLFWMVSDQASRVFTYDRRRGKAIQHFSFGAAGKPIRKAEGVTLDREAQYLYVVSDADAELNRFRIVD
ncbi:SdiA-regulated [Gimesia panareensis]|uniref:SdiA-regulated n=1 Tax=Gimesia panareensis TaxID=2527978 RepID=A0A518FZ54_9PLAN|nr:SdiA-regulated domain-containing protein [Gimesia panareensis]QDV21623.1 SdiA-regulated [Gimesia panareensis]